MSTRAAVVLALSLTLGCIATPEQMEDRFDDEFLCVLFGMTLYESERANAKSVILDRGLIGEDSGDWAAIERHEVEIGISRCAVNAIIGLADREGWAPPEVKLYFTGFAKLGNGQPTWVWLEDNRVTRFK